MTHLMKPGYAPPYKAQTECGGVVAPPDLRRLRSRRRQAGEGGSPMPAAAKRKLTDLIDTPLLRAIHACAREHKVDRDGLHEAIEAGFKKKSLKELTRAEAFRLLDGLRGNKPGKYVPRLENPHRRRAQNAHGRKDYDASADAIYPAAAPEHQLLRDAATLRKWDDATLTAFIQRQLGKPVVVTLADFNKVFWALKSMNRREGLHE
jgi:hypothetical protein